MIDMDPFLEAKVKQRLDDFAEELQSLGFRAAHPDDGWVDRENNIVQFAYPQLMLTLRAGDKVALGWADKYRTVYLVEKLPKRMFDINDPNRWRFTTTPSPNSRPSAASGAPAQHHASGAPCTRSAS